MTRVHFTSLLALLVLTGGVALGQPSADRLAAGAAKAGAAAGAAGASAASRTQGAPSDYKAIGASIGARAGSIVRAGMQGGKVIGASIARTGAWLARGIRHVPVLDPLGQPPLGRRPTLLGGPDFEEVQSIRRKLLAAGRQVPRWSVRFGCDPAELGRVMRGEKPRKDDPFLVFQFTYRFGGRASRRDDDEVGLPLPAIRPLTGQTSEGGEESGERWAQAVERIDEEKAAREAEAWAKSQRASRAEQVQEVYEEPKSGSLLDGVENVEGLEPGAKDRQVPGPGAPRVW